MQCRQSAWALGQMGPKAKEAIPALERATGDSRHNVREYVREALEKIQR